ncbi:oligosaccharide flippase family protein [Labilibacter marinus]|uniref:oligosaccharide flippase family protein n=1 Tax=Labilibacter marinus TaxID=1477105 RepID=UPI0009500B7E|nr:oligosaccharide flippase family protein [Labilibacter marinus]
MIRFPKSLVGRINSIYIHSDFKRLLSNFVSLTILQSANYILPLISLPYLVRVLGTDKFGLVMFAQAFILYFTVLTDYGFNLSATREISISRINVKKVSEIFSAVMLIKILLLIASFLIMISIISFFDRFEENKNIFVYTFGIVIGQTFFPIWLFQGLERMKYITILNIVAKLIFTIAIFVFVKEEAHYNLVPIFNSLGYIVVGIISLYVVFFKFSINFIIPSKSLVLSLFKESTHLFISNVSISLFSASNVFILGLFTSNNIVGVYSSMEKIIVAVKSLYTPLYQSIFPWLSNKEADVVKRIVKQMFPFIFIVGVVICSTLIFFGESILDLLYDDKLISENALIFKLFAFISIFASLSMLFNMLYLTSIKAYSKRMKVMLIGGLYSVSATVILTYYFGFQGTAVSAVSVELLLLVLGLYYFKKKLN